MSDRHQSALKLERMSEIRELLKRGPMNTQDIAEATRTNENTLRHSLLSLQGLGHIACKRQLIRRALSLNIYTITEFGLTIAPYRAPKIERSPIKFGNCDWWRYSHVRTNHG